MTIYSSTATSPYTHLWSKYRPAILKLMVDSADEPQSYQFSDHEFRNLNPRKKSGFAFNITVYKGKLVYKIKVKDVAKDLLRILNQSKTASELIEEIPFNFILDKQFVLHISRADLPPENEDDNDAEDSEGNE